MPTNEDSVIITTHAGSGFEKSRPKRIVSFFGVAGQYGPQADSIRGALLNSPKKFGGWYIG